MPDVVRAVPVEPLDERRSVQRLHAALGLGALRAEVFTLAEGMVVHDLRLDGEGFYLVLDGTAEIEVDGAEHRVGEREAVAVAPGLAHSLANVGLGPLTYVVLQVPGESTGA